MALVAITLLQVDQVLVKDCCCQDRSRQDSFSPHSGCCSNSVPLCCRSSSEQSRSCQPSGDSKPCQCHNKCCGDATPAAESKKCASSNEEKSLPLVWFNHTNSEISLGINVFENSSLATSGLDRCVMLCCFRL